MKISREWRTEERLEAMGHIAVAQKRVLQRHDYQAAYHMTIAIGLLAADSAGFLEANRATFEDYVAQGEGEEQ